MNRKELYQKTVNVLLDAYNKRELHHQECTACAVGNICKETSKITGIRNSQWLALFYTTYFGVQRDCENNPENIALWSDKPNHFKSAHELIAATGYTKEELMKVEFAFETAGDEQGEQYKGLCAVLDVLKEIHESEEVIHEENKIKLNKVHKELVTV